MRTWSRLAGVCCLVAAGFVAQVAVARPAAAGWQDVVHTFDATYVVLPGGDVNVTQTLDYEFGVRGRPGVELDVPARVPWDSGRDAIYELVDVTVASPTGAATAVSQRTIEEGGVGHTRLRIGDPGQPADRTETYVISYTIVSPTEAQPGYDEFVWDVAGGGLGVPVEAMDVTVVAPGGVHGVSCFTDQVAETPCAQAMVAPDGRAHYAARNLAADTPFLLSAKLLSGTVAAGPELEPRPDPVRRTLVLGGIGMLTATLAMAAVAGWVRRARDGAPRAAPRQHVPADQIHLQPPDVPPAEASLLVDGVFLPRHTAATLLDLATRGVLQVGPAVAGEATLRIADLAGVEREYEYALLERLFRDPHDGASVTIGPRRAIREVQGALRRAVCAVVTERGWFPPRPVLFPAPTLLGLALLIGGVLALSDLSVSGVLAGRFGWALIAGLTLLPVVVGGIWIRRWCAGVRPTPAGAARRDEVQRHRDALAALEADQVPEDSRMLDESLPWAVAVDDTERWASITQEAITLGRVPDTVPRWWLGATFSPFEVIGVVRALEAAAAGPGGIPGQVPGRP